MHSFIFRHRLKGNEYFKSSDFELALREYSQSLNYLKSAAIYNNRAITCMYLYISNILSNQHHQYSCYHTAL